MLLQAADCELNPGPKGPKYPCLVCTKAVRWNQQAIACDNCEGCYHTNCIDMGSHIYHALAKPDVSWICCQCGFPNFSTSFFESIDITTSNLYDPLTADISLDSDIGDPISASSSKHHHKANHNHSVKSETMKILTINFQSIKAKREALWNLVESCKPDIILGCETWLKPTITNQEVMPPGYELYRNDRQDGYGGVLVAVKSNYISSIVDIDFHSEIVAVQIEGADKSSIAVASLYRQPNRDIEHTHTLCNDIRRIIELHKTSTICIGGDANLPDIDWANDTITGNKYPKDINEHFLCTKSDMGLNQIIDFPTREDVTLELFLTNRPNLVHRCVGIPGISDHDTIAYVETLSRAKYQKPAQRKIFIWKRADINALRTDMSDYAKDYHGNSSVSTDVNIPWNTFTEQCNHLMEKHIPSKMSSQRFNQVWIDRKVKRLSRKKKRCYNRAQKTGQQRDWERFKQLKKETQKTCRDAYNS